MECTTPDHLAVLLAQAAAHDTGYAAVLGTTAHGVIAYWNKRAESRFGWRTDEALGRNILDVTPTRNRADQATRVLGQVRRGEPWSGRSLAQRRDGTPIVVDDPGHPVALGDQIIGIVGVSRHKTRDAAH
jgi:PAS domain S-box-containing protein